MLHLIGSCKGRLEKYGMVSNLWNLLYKIQEKGVDGKALNAIRGEIGSLTLLVRGLPSRMCNYAMKCFVDSIENDIVKINRVVMNKPVTKNEVHNSSEERMMQEREDKGIKV